MTTSIAPSALPAELKHALERLASHEHLTESESHAAMARVMEGNVPDPAIAAFLTALRMKGETAAELAGAVRAVRERMMPFVTVREVLDTCGTGGDGTNSVNISTAVAIIAAASGVPVAKHGNRSASGNSGSAEVLTELGVVIESDPDVLHKCLNELGLTFLFAPKFHGALRHVAPVRKLLPFRTLFNLVGPLANPARPAYQLVGVAGQKAGDLVAETLLLLGLKRGAVVTGGDGLDEVSLNAPTEVRWIEHGRMTRRAWNPDEFGLGRVTPKELAVSGPRESAERLLGLFRGEAGAVRSIVLANAAAALLVAGRVEDLQSGVKLAASAIDSGNALQLLGNWEKLTRGVAS